MRREEKYTSYKKSSIPQFMKRIIWFVQTGNYH